MSAFPLNLNEVDEWLAELAAIEGVESASRHPGRINTPGVLVRIMDIRLDTLAQDAWKVDLDVRLIVGDLDVGAAQEALVDLLNAVRPFFGNPPGSFTPGVYTMPDSTTRPTLGFAHTITIEQE